MVKCMWLKDQLPSLFMNDSGHYKSIFDKALEIERDQTQKENKYQFNLICELIDIIENPEHSNQIWKDVIIEISKEKGYGYEDE